MALVVFAPLARPGPTTAGIRAPVAPAPARLWQYAVRAPRALQAPARVAPPARGRSVAPPFAHRASRSQATRVRVAARRRWVTCALRARSALVVRPPRRRAVCSGSSAPRGVSMKQRRRARRARTGARRRRRTQSAAGPAAAGPAATAPQAALRPTGCSAELGSRAQAARHRL